MNLYEPSSDFPIKSELSCRSFLFEIICQHLDDIRVIMPEGVQYKDMRPE
jgi:hypothetical protein